MSVSIVKHSVFPLIGNIMRYFIQILRAGIIARFILPSEFGIVAAVQGIIGLTAVMGDFGMSTSALQRRNLSQNAERAFYSINIFIGLAIFAILFTLAPRIGKYFSDDNAVKIVYVLSINYLIVSLYSQALVKLKRNLKFMQISLIEFGTILVSSIIGVTLAISNYGFWALIMMQLCESVLLLICYFVFAKPNLGYFIIDKEVKDSMKFGLFVNIMNILNRITKNIDISLLGKYTGLVSAGLYSRAIMLTNILNIQIRGTIYSVSFPTLSKYQNDKNIYNIIVKETYSLTLLINAFFGGILFWFSDRIIPLYLGNGWEEVIPLLRIICISLIFIPFNTIVDQIFLSIGYAKGYVRIGVTRNCLKLVFIPVGIIYFGAIGCVASIVSAEAISSFIIYIYTLKHFKYSSELIKSMIPPFLFSIIAGSTCVWIGEFIALNIIFSLFILIFIYSIIYFLLYFYIPLNEKYIRLNRNDIISYLRRQK